MRITQGTFSFLDELTDEQIAAQARYALERGWAISIEYTDDPHPRNPYWAMWGQPLFDLEPEDTSVVMRELQACREDFPSHYIKITAYDTSFTRQTTAMSFIVQRPLAEPGFRLDRTDAHDRVLRYRLHAYAADDPVGRRYPDGPANGARS